MRLLEYESKEILAKRGIPIPSGAIISIIERTFLPQAVIKDQIPTRGIERQEELWKFWIKRK